MTTRLTKDLRRSIINTLLTKKFSKRESELEKRKEKIAQIMYKLIVPKKYSDIVDTLPEGWVKQCNRAVFIINVDDASVKRKNMQVIFDSPKESLYQVNGIDTSSYYGTSGQDISVLDPIITDVKREMILDVLRDVESMEKEFDELHSELTTIIYSVPTTKKLFEVWPEVESMLPKEFQFVKTTSLAKIDTTKAMKMLSCG